MLFQKSFSKTKTFFTDRYHLLFHGATENHLRIQNALKNPDGTYQVTLKFASYTELKKYQKKLRRITVSLSSAVAMVIVAVIVAPYVMNPNKSAASNYSWVQTAWDATVGVTNMPASTGANITHPATGTSWVKKDDGIVPSPDNSSVTLVQSTPQNVNETGYASDVGAIPTGAYVDAANTNALTLKKPAGFACAGAGECAGTGAACTGTPTICVASCNGTEVAGNFCAFGGIVYGFVTGADGKIWMDRNLGATAVASAYNTQAAYGWLFQWGRGADGHQYTAWGGQTSPALSSTVAATTSFNSTDTVASPNDVKFITSNFGNYDWHNPQNLSTPTNLWDGTMANNPCPIGFRVPTQTEWAAIANPTGTANDITNYTTAASTTLHLPAAGRRVSDSSLTSQASLGYYWSSTPTSPSAYGFAFTSSGVGSASGYSTSTRASGFSVRCIKN